MQRLSVRREMSAPESGHVTRPSARGALRAPMSARLRITILVLCSLLWLSGCLWLLLHFAFPQSGEFGPLPNPWEASVLRVHGLLAVAGVFLFGWVASGHLVERWDGTRSRTSGLTLAACALLLVVSGYALYYTTGVLHELAARSHEVLGAIALIAALLHWWRSAAARAGRAARRRP